MAQTPPVQNESLCGSPPPNCAICLGKFNNKCFSDSCMHQFCFACLLEWSKVKPECPLCKQPFKSIIHNVKSNNEYDEHVLENVNVNLDLGPPPMVRLPRAHSARHQFHFSTTFTVDPSGELAIQQLLLPIEDYIPGSVRYRYVHADIPGRRRNRSTTAFRQEVYANNYWANPIPDLSGRFREITPRFYRENPAARQRLAPWLNRELNALLNGNTQHVMHIVDVIMAYLLTHHIHSRAFRSFLVEHLGDRTDHFIHEFHTFMKSPYDMIGYDRQVAYSYGSQLSDVVVSDYETDSDVAVNGSASTFTSNRFSGVIEIDSDTSHDSDVIIQETAPPVIDLVDSDTNETPTVTNEIPSTLNEIIGNTTDEVIEGSSVDDSESRKPVLPPKLRLKHKRQSHEKTSRNKRKRNITSSSSSSSTDSSSSSSTDSSSDMSIPNNPRKRLKHRKEFGKYRQPYKSTERDRYRHSRCFDTDASDERSNLNHSSDSEAAPIKQRWKARNKKLKCSKPSGHDHTLTSPRYNKRPPQYSRSSRSFSGSDNNSSSWNNSNSSQETHKGCLLDNKPSTCTENKYRNSHPNAYDPSYSYLLHENIPSCSRNSSERTASSTREKPSDISTETCSVNNSLFNHQNLINNRSYSTNTRSASPEDRNVYKRYWGLSEEINFPSCSNYISEVKRDPDQEENLFYNSTESFRNNSNLNDDSNESFKESFSTAHHHLKHPSVPSKIVMAFPIKQAAENSDSE